MYLSPVDSPDAMEVTAQARDVRLLRWLTRAIICVLALLFLEASPKAAALNEVVSESAEFTGPQLKLLALDGQASRAVQLSTALSIDVTGLLARATLKQQFRNDSAEWVEAGVSAAPASRCRCAQDGPDAR